MLKIGITGGIGSGKSTVCKVFEFLGIPVYSADLRAREITNTDAAVVKAISSAYGSDIYGNEGLDRKRLSTIVFQNPEKLAELNAIVHPAVFEDFRKWTEEQHNFPYVMKEAALMFESGSFRDLDYVINVNCPKELRIKRVMQRDGITRRAVLLRMKNQLTDRERSARADFIIVNNERKALIPQVLSLHALFMQMAQPLENS